MKNLLALVQKQKSGWIRIFVGWISGIWSQNDLVVQHKSFEFLYIEMTKKKAKK